MQQQRVLIFDEEEVFALIATQVLSRHSIDVRHCRNCDNVIGILTEVEPHLILMDNKIPYIGGVEATRSIKKHSSFSRVPVIYFSSHPDIIRLAAEAQADDYLQKPFEVKDLVTIVQNHLKYHCQSKENERR